MSSNPSSVPPSPSTEPSNSLETTVSRSKPAFRDSLWRPILCCAGALGLGVSLFPLLKPSQTQANTAGPAILPEIVLASENTLIVTPTAPPGALLRGRIRLVAGETDALGRAKVSGLVARHLVESGAVVKQGDAVMEITSGARRKMVPASEFRQDRAEQSQIAAANAQNSLAQKIGVAQTQLRVAQDRVSSAQKQVSQARDVVRRLQNGESVAPGEIPAEFRSGEASPARAKTRKRRRKGVETPPTGETRATRLAARQAEAARSAAQESARALETARTMLADVQSAARQAEEKAQSAAKAVVDVEARFDAKKATGADVEAARSAQKEAQSAVDAANKAVIPAKTELAKREKSAATAQSGAQSSAAEAAKSLASVRLETAADKPDVAPEIAPEMAAPTPDLAAKVTLDGAIRFAGAALDESRRASRDAERLHTQIDNYESQVKTSRNRIESATQNLAQAQQGVMDSVPRPQFSTTYAPASGIVTWISRLAREVGAGDSVFGIASNQRTAARFEDKSGLWRAIKPGTTLSAFVVDAPAPNGSAASTAKNTGATNGLKTTENLGVGHAVQLKMTQIEAPVSEGEGAKLTGIPLAQRGAALPDGAEVLVSMPRPGQKATLSVPISALMQRGKVTYVALLMPIPAATLADAAVTKAVTKPTSAPPASPEAQIPATQPTPKGEVQSAGEQFRLQWTQVETGRNDGLRLEITSGLVAGARVVSEPEELEAMGFAPAPAQKPTVLNTSGTTGAAPQASSAQLDAPAPPAEVLVRLTPMMS